MAAARGKCRDAAALSLRRLALWLVVRARRLTILHVVTAGLALVVVVLAVEQMLIMHLPAARYVIESPLLGLQTNPRVGVSEGVVLFSVREFSRVCCDLGPTIYRATSMLDRAFYDRGRSERAQYSFAAALGEWKHKFDAKGSARAPGLRSESIKASSDGDDIGAKLATRIFVPTAMVHEFLNEFFLPLPSHARISIVTGQEDCGPSELFGFGRKKCIQSKIPMSLGAFLSDERLVSWFAQNYDIVGCKTVEATRIAGCHDPELDTTTRGKMKPLPIGLDFHTIAEKRRFGRMSPAAQQEALLSASSVPWKDKPLQTIAIFKVEVNKPDRGVLAQQLDSKHHLVECVLKPPKMSRREFWELHDKAAFVLSPQGNGIDTHRVFETLNLGSVPIVHSSPLDPLYEKFPIIILKQWSDFVSCDMLEEWRTQIVNRFGPDPFKSPEVQKELRLSYWVEQVRLASQLPGS